MEQIYRNESLLQLTTEDYYIHDSTVTRFDIYEKDHQLCIDVYFNSGGPEYKNGKKLKIHFSDIVRYQFLWNNSHHFYNVESYKFFKCELGHYISLDPFDESTEISENDEDVIVSKNVEGYFV